MNRRGFLATLIAGAVLDPERLLWVPGKKLISIPKPPLVDPRLVISPVTPAALADYWAGVYYQKAYDEFMTKWSATHPNRATIYRAHNSPAARISVRRFTTPHHLQKLHTNSRSNRLQYPKNT
jgi:hypothetical protein